MRISSISSDRDKRSYLNKLHRLYRSGELWGEKFHIDSDGIVWRQLIEHREAAIKKRSFARTLIDRILEWVRRLFRRTTIEERAEAELEILLQDANACCSEIMYWQK